jgi:cation diffusion facilitator family transporter
MAGESKKTVYAALAANVSIAIVKGIGGVVTGSSALLAEAAHSLADSTNQVLLLCSIPLGDRKPDEEHPFGHGKERFFWAFLVAVLLFFGGGLFSIGEAVLSFVSGHGERSTRDFVVIYAILAFALLAESLSLLRATRQLRHEADERETEFHEHVRESRNPTVKVTFYEDGAAVIGVLVALAGTVATQVTGNELYDGLAAGLIGLLLIAVAFRLGGDTRDLLVGAAAAPEERRAICDVIESSDAVDSVSELLTMHLGPDSILVAARVHLADTLAPDELAVAMEEVEQRLREAVPAIDYVFFDPTPGVDAVAGRVRS